MKKTAYLSSTNEDLRAHREAVREWAAKAEWTLKAQEDYAAAPITPLKKCLDDIDASEVYIGLFGWRYGSVPASGDPGDDERSFTEREFLYAQSKGKKILCFLVGDPNAAPPEAHDPRALQLRKLAAGQYLAGSFTTPESCSNAVLAALSRLDLREEPLRPPAHGPRRLAPHFVGREQELRQLEEWLGRIEGGARTGRPFVATLAGMGGLGKKELALQLSERSVGKRGVVWIDAAACKDAEALYDAISRVAAVPPMHRTRNNQELSTKQRLTALLNDLSVNLPLLIVFGDVPLLKNADRLTRTTLEGLFGVMVELARAPRPAISLLLTTRYHSLRRWLGDRTEIDSHWLEIKPLEAAESDRLLRAGLGPDDLRLDADRAATALLCERTGGLPLALKLAVETLRSVERSKQPIAEFVRDLSALEVTDLKPTRASDEIIDDEEETIPSTVAACIDATFWHRRGDRFELVNPEPALLETYGALGACSPSSFALRTAAAAAQLSQASQTVASRLQVLQRMSLVTKLDDDRWGLLPPIAAHARRLAADPPRDRPPFDANSAPWLADARRSHAHAMFKTILGIEGDGRPLTLVLRADVADAVLACRWLTEQWRAAAAAPETRGQRALGPTDVCPNPEGTLETLFSHIEIFGPRAEGASLFKDLGEAAEMNDGWKEAIIFRTRSAKLYAGVGDFASSDRVILPTFADVNEAGEPTSREPDHLGLNRESHGLLGRIADTDLRHVMEIRVLLRRGALERMRKQPVKALALYRNALALAEDRGVRDESLRNAHSSLGIALASTGDPREAVHHFESAIALSKEIHDTGDVAGTEVRLGDALLRAGDTAAAERAFERAVEGCDSEARGRVSKHLGTVAKKLEEDGNVEGALLASRCRTEAARGLPGQTLSLAISLINRAKLHNQRQELDDALAVLEELARNAGLLDGYMPPYSLALNLGVAFKNDGRYDAAIAAFAAAIAIVKGSGKGEQGAVQIANAHNQIGLTYLGPLHDLVRAEEAFQAQVEWVTKTGDPSRLNYALVGLAEVAEQRGDATRAEQTLLKGLECRAFVGEPGARGARAGRGVAVVASALAEFSMKQGRLLDASRYLLEARTAQIRVGREETAKTSKSRNVVTDAVNTCLQWAYNKPGGLAELIADWPARPGGGVPSDDNERSALAHLFCQARKFASSKGEEDLAVRCLQSAFAWGYRVDKGGAHVFVASLLDRLLDEDGGKQLAAQLTDREATTDAEQYLRARCLKRLGESALSQEPERGAALLDEASRVYLAIGDPTSAVGVAVILASDAHRRQEWPDVWRQLKIIAAHASALTSSTAVYGLFEDLAEEVDKLAGERARGPRAEAEQAGPPGAAEVLRLCIRVAEEAGDKRAEARANSLLGRRLAKSKDIVGARRSFQRQLELAKESDDPSGAAYGHMGLAKLYYEGSPALALEEYAAVEHALARIEPPPEFAKDFRHATALASALLRSNDAIRLACVTVALWRDRRSFGDDHTSQMAGELASDPGMRDAILRGLTPRLFEEWVTAGSLAARGAPALIVETCKARNRPRAPQRPGDPTHAEVPDRLKLIALCNAMVMAPIGKPGRSAAPETLLQSSLGEQPAANLVELDRYLEDRALPADVPARLLVLRYLGDKRMVAKEWPLAREVLARRLALAKSANDARATLQTLESQGELQWSQGMSADACSTWLDAIRISSEELKGTPAEAARRIAGVASNRDARDTICRELLKTLGTSAPMGMAALFLEVSRKSAQAGDAFEAVDRLRGLARIAEASRDGAWLETAIQLLLPPIRGASPATLAELGSRPRRHNVAEAAAATMIHLVRAESFQREQRFQEALEALAEAERCDREVCDGAPSLDQAWRSLGPLRCELLQAVGRKGEGRIVLHQLIGRAHQAGDTDLGVKARLLLAEWEASEDPAVAIDALRQLQPLLVQPASTRYATRIEAVLESLSRPSPPSDGPNPRSKIDPAEALTLGVQMARSLGHTGFLGRAYDRMGVYFEDAGDLPAAEAAFRGQSEMGPELIADKGRQSLVRLFEKMGRFDEAAGVLEKTGKAIPAQSLRARALFASGEYAKAAREWLRVGRAARTADWNLVNHHIAVDLEASLAEPGGRDKLLAAIEEASAGDKTAIGAYLFRSMVMEAYRLGRPLPPEQRILPLWYGLRIALRVGNDKEFQDSLGLLAKQRELADEPSEASIAGAVAPALGERLEDILWAVRVAMKVDDASASLEAGRSFPRRRA
jgi:tetratricopeptide (TPR) repeat protein